MFTLFVFVIVLAILVLAHECGHFFAAKAAGVKVLEFGIGFPPRLLSFRYGETKYSLNAIPLGGFVKIFGENGEVQGDVRSFTSRSVATRLWIISAGVLMNVVLAFGILMVGYLTGLPKVLQGNETYVQERHVAVLSVLPSTPASEAHMKPGDRMVSVDGIPVTSVQELQTYLAQKVGVEVLFAVDRQRKTMTISLIPQLLQATGRGGIGVGLADMGIVRYGFWDALWQAFLDTGLLLWGIVRSLGVTLWGVVAGVGPTLDVAGPVGVASLTSEAARRGIAYLLQFMAVLSLNLAVINFLPFPALDGGRAFILGLEGMRRKPLAPRYEAWLHAVGFSLLMLAVVMITYKDIVRLFF